MKYLQPILTILSSLFVFFQTTAQIPENILPKLQGLLPMEVFHEPEVYFGSADLKPNAAPNLPVIIEVTALEIFSEIENLGGRVNTREGNLATVQLPKKSLAGVAALPGVISLEYNKVVRQNNIARQHVRADLVQQGLNPLPQGYTGQGVVVGVIDFGLDFRHPDFRDPLDPSKSRIIAAWDLLSEEGNPPPGYSYGSFWSRPQIEAELGSNPPGLVDLGNNESFGHGTHVTGIAAGNEGMAPGADIIFVNDDGSDAGFVDAIRFIRDYAKNAGKPCVINISSGYSLNGHAGTDYFAQMADNLLAGTTQFAIVAAAGNEGSMRSHWGSSYFHSDTAMMFTGVPSGAYLYLQIPKIYADSLYFAVGTDSAFFDISQNVFKGSAHFSDVTPWKKISSMNFYQAEWLLRESGDTAAVVEFYPRTVSETNYYKFFVFIGDIPPGIKWNEHPEGLDLFRLMFRGTGSFETWMQGGPFLSFVVNNPQDLGLPTTHYIPSDNDFGILSPASGKNVIAVGAYVNRSEWTDITGQSHYFITDQPTGALADFSSHGPTYDGRLKPEITAPGKHVISSYPTDYEALGVPLDFLSQGNPFWLLTDTAIAHSCYSGTSMASPVVAGSVALLMEAKPDLNYAEIRKLLITTALTDAFTDASGPLPNGLFGYGKLDIFSAVLAALGLSETENIAPDSPFAAFPNPATDLFFLKLTDENPRPEARLRLLDVQGKVVFEKTGISNFETVRTAGFAPGVYFLEMTDGGRKMFDKIWVMK